MVSCYTKLFLWQTLQFPCILFYAQRVLWKKKDEGGFTEGLSSSNFQISLIYNRFREKSYWLSKYFSLLTLAAFHYPSVLSLTKDIKGPFFYFKGFTKKHNSIKIEEIRRTPAFIHHILSKSHLNQGQKTWYYNKPFPKTLSCMKHMYYRF